MSAQLDFRVAVEQDVAAATETIASAFSADPVWSRVFGLPGTSGMGERQGQMDTFRCWWRLFVETAAGYDGLWIAGACEAVAVWVAPGCPEFGPEQEQRAERLIDSLPGPAGRYLQDTLARFEAARPERAHHYLSLLGVHADHCGRGIGMALLAHTLTAIDATGSPAYLESTNPANLDRYRSVGFKDRSEFSLPDDGPTVTTMWRRARTNA